MITLLTAMSVGGGGGCDGSGGSPLLPTDAETPRWSCGSCWSVVGYMPRHASPDQNHPLMTF